MKEQRGFVFVHGIVGNNRIFDFLVPLIPEGCRVKWVVLEGHGGDALGFSRASMDGWKRQVADFGLRPQHSVEDGDDFRG